MSGVREPRLHLSAPAVAGLQDYAQFVLSRCKPGEDVLSSLDADKAHLAHMANGLATETGELIGPLKKHLYYGRDLDVENVKEEAGDLLFYLTAILSACGLTIDDALAANMAKLTKRYADKYTDAEAAARADKA